MDSAAGKVVKKLQVVKAGEHLRDMLNADVKLQ